MRTTAAQPAGRRGTTTGHDGDTMNRYLIAFLLLALSALVAR